MKQFFTFYEIGETKYTDTPPKMKAEFTYLGVEGYQMTFGLDFYVELVQLARSLVVVTEIEGLCRGCGTQKYMIIGGRGGLA